MRVLGFLLFLGLSSSIFANPIEDLISEWELEPLAGSSFAKENPGVLPYEECKILRADGRRVRGHEITAGMRFYVYRDKFSLFCFSKTLKIGYQIPLKLEKDVTIGVALGLGLLLFSSGHVRNLDGKKLTELYGDFKGFSGGLGLGSSVSGALLRHNGIFLSLNESGGINSEVKAAFRKVHVGTRVLEHKEVYQRSYYERVKNLVESAKQNEQNILMGKDLTANRKELEEQRTFLLNIPDSQKYNSTWKFWIHHLVEDRYDSVCQTVSRHRPAQVPCSKSQIEYAKYFGDLDYEFLDTLKFKKIDD